MKFKVTLSLIVLFFCSEILAQDIVFYKGKKDYVPAQVIFTNGKTLNGYIKDFTLPKSVEVSGILYSFKSFERKLQLDRTKFSFKTQVDGESSPLHADSIQKIILNEDQPIEYEKLKLKTVNSKNQLVDTKLEVFLPLIERGEIDLYGLKVVNESGRLVTWLAYIKKPQDNFAVIPIDMSNFNIMNAWGMEERLITGFMEITKDCPAYQASLQEMLKKSKQGGKEYRKQQQQKTEEFLATCNCGENIEQLFTSFYFTMYKEMIKDYSNSCN